jgi:Flp pilus assembly pilin Flp
MSGRLRRIMKREDGASAVEFALVSIPLLLLIIGMIQFGIIFNQWLMIEHAAREGARWAGLRNEASFVRDQVIASAPGLGIEEGDITITPADPVAAQPNTSISVRVEHEAPVITPFMEAIFGADVSLAAQSTQRVE